MDGQITGETDDLLGVSVIDNDGIEHVLDVRKEDGEITAHQQEGYPDDPSKRTPEGNEHVEQARRFAQYYVYRERGHDTVPNQINPDRIHAVGLLLAGMTESAVQEWFGDLYQQLKSHHSDVSRPVELPAEINTSESVLYRKNVFLGFDPLETDLADRATELAADYGIDLTEIDPNTHALEDVTEDRIADWTAFADALAEETADRDTTLTAGLSLDAVSPLYLAYVDADGHEHITDVADPHDREPDTLFELPPIDPGSLRDFHQFLVFNTRCQIRDCFIRMGLQPPEPVQIRGYGRYEATEQYKTLDMFPDYTDTADHDLFP